MHAMEAGRVRAAYRAAVAALDELRQAIVAAGVDLGETESQVSETRPETVDDRRRRLKAERQRRWRERLQVDAGPSTRETPSVYAASTGASTERLHGDGKASTERLQSVYKTSTGDASGPRACARSSSEEIISPPVCYANIPPLKTEGGDDPHKTGDASPTVSEVAPPAAPVAASEVAAVAAPVDSPAATRKRKGRERPAQPRGSTIDPSDGSPPVPASDRASGSKHGDRPPTDLDRVWSAYVSAVAPVRPRRTPPRETLIERRLRDYTAEELERSIRGYGRSAFHRGENDRGRPYQALELWLRDAAHVEAGWGYLAGTGAARPQRKGAPKLDGIGDAWQEYEARRAAEQAAIDRDVFAELIGVEKRQ